jgi:hypothetical protein
VGGRVCVRCKESIKPRAAYVGTSLCSDGQTSSLPRGLRRTIDSAPIVPYRGIPETHAIAECVLGASGTVEVVPPGSPSPGWHIPRVRVMVRYVSSFE